MLGRDIEISEILSKIYKEKSFPAYIDATTGKIQNRVITAIKKLIWFFTNDYGNAVN